MTDDLEVLWLNDPEPPRIVELVCVKCGFARKTAVDRLGEAADIDASRKPLVASKCSNCGSLHASVRDFQDGVLVIKDEAGV